MELDYYKKYEPIDGKWYINKKLGNGAFGTVLEVERRDQTRMKSALKVVSVPSVAGEVDSYREENYDLDEKSVTSYFYGFVEEFIKEFQLMSELKGYTNIVAIEDYEVKERTDEFGWDIFIRMELLTPMNKFFAQNTPHRNDVIKLGIDICKALEVCQKYKIIHRDIKPSNIFVSDMGEYKLGDFGVARTLEKTSGGLSKKGTYTYMAPEVFRGDAYGANVDIYSLGIVMYKLLNNNLEPFRKERTHSDEENALSRRLNGEVFPSPANADGRLAEIVLKACSFDPKERYDNPTTMREDLEAVLQKNAEDETLTSAEPVSSKEDAVRTVGLFGRTSSDAAIDGTIGLFGTDSDSTTGDKTSSLAGSTVSDSATTGLFGSELDSSPATLTAFPAKKTTKKIHPLLLIIPGAVVALIFVVIVISSLFGNSEPSVSFNFSDDSLDVTTETDNIVEEIPHVAAEVKVVDELGDVIVDSSNITTIRQGYDGATAGYYIELLLSDAGKTSLRTSAASCALKAFSFVINGQAIATVKTYGSLGNEESLVFAGDESEYQADWITPLYFSQSDIEQIISQLATAPVTNPTIEEPLPTVNPTVPKTTPNKVTTKPTTAPTTTVVPCSVCGSTEHQQHPCNICGATYHLTAEHPRCSICNSTDHTASGHPSCSICGSTAHTSSGHPSCSICGSTAHTSSGHPRCAVCGSTDHQTHPSTTIKTPSSYLVDKYSKQ